MHFSYHFLIDYFTPETYIGIGSIIIACIAIFFSSLQGNKFVSLICSVFLPFHKKVPYERYLINRYRYNRILIEYQHRDLSFFKKDCIRYGYAQGIKDFLTNVEREEERIRDFMNNSIRNLDKLCAEHGNHPNWYPSWRPEKADLSFFNQIICLPHHVYKLPGLEYKFYKGSHGFFGVIKYSKLDKPKIFIGGNLKGVIRKTIFQYQEIIRENSDEFMSESHFYTISEKNKTSVFDKMNK